MRDLAKVRRAIVTAAANQCQELLRPYKETRPHEYLEVWRIVSQMVIDHDTHPLAQDQLDIYDFCWKLDYFAYDCTTSYMDIMIMLRRSFTSFWLQDQRAKLRKKGATHGR